MIIGSFGNLGAGKTIFMVLLAYIRKSMGSVIYSNFKMVGCNDIDKITDLLSLENCVVIIDDIIPWLDARQSMSNTFLTQLMMLGRKKGVHVLYTSQYEGGQDVRLRVITNVCVYPYLIEFPYFGMDWWIGFRGEKDSELLYEDLIIRYDSEVYDWYDTLEVAYQKVEYDEIFDLYNKLKNAKRLFITILNIRYNIQKTMGDQIFDVIHFNLVNDYLEEMLLKSGYVLE